MALVDTIIGAMLGFGAAIFVEPIKSWLYGPRFEVSFSDGPEFQTQTHERRKIKSAEYPKKETNIYHKASYIRIKIINTKSALAKGCRAYLVNVQKENDNGKFCDTIYCDSIPLAWSCRGEQRFLPVDIPKDVNMFVDLLSTRQISTNFKPELQFHLYRYVDLFKQHGKFKFTIQISGENVNPKFINILFAWNGAWDQYSCKSVP